MLIWLCVYLSNAFPRHSKEIPFTLEIHHHWLGMGLLSFIFLGVGGPYNLRICNYLQLREVFLYYLHGICFLEQFVEKKKPMKLDNRDKKPTLDRTGILRSRKYRRFLLYLELVSCLCCLSVIFFKWTGLIQYLITVYIWLTMPSHTFQGKTTITVQESMV